MARVGAGKCRETLEVEGTGDAGGYSAIHESAYVTAPATGLTDKPAAAFSGVVMTVYSSGISAASLDTSGFARVSLCDVMATIAMFGRHGRVSEY